MTDIAQTATGESTSSLLWLAVGAAVGAAIVAPMLASWLGLSYEIALVLGGAAIAYFASGAIKKAGHGSALLGVGLLAVRYVAPLFGRVTGAVMGKNSNAPGVFV